MQQLPKQSHDQQSYLLSVEHEQEKITQVEQESEHSFEEKDTDLEQDFPESRDDDLLEDPSISTSLLLSNANADDDDDDDSRIETVMGIDNVGELPLD